MLTIRDQENLSVVLLDTLLTKIRDEYSIQDIFGRDAITKWAEASGYVPYEILADEKRSAAVKQAALRAKLNSIIEDL